MTALTPVAGGPDPWPATREMDVLSGWERNADGSENAFCGTMRYRAIFDAPRLDATTLDLGDVRQSAHVWLNGRDLGKTFLAPFRVMVPQGCANLLCPGRAISVERDVLGPLRVMAPCMAMGEACGVAAEQIVAGTANADVES